MHVFQETQEVNQIFGPKPIGRQSQSTVTVVDDKCTCAAKEAAATKIICVMEDAAQTSDHAICFVSFYHFLRTVGSFVM